ncbi:helix-turn-helix domain-containing protein [Amycolatopsis solani]|uniref:helix-turn-helix domain-containing protein n=1 Tax=Amycolatopsis solani TaxID=3028615 RepID=UPI0025B1D6B0|nr:helix-turn-helix domain-containing protein [Amycolatopsis sp. MEP2-6]
MDFHTEKNRDLKHVPKLTGNAPQRAQRADADAAQLARDIRHYDVNQIWGRLNRWAETSPTRLLAAAVHLAAMAQPRVPGWCDDLGGTIGLHPDYDPARHRAADPNTPHAPAKMGKHDQAIIDLAGKGVHDNAIARQLGLSRRTVNRIRGAYGLPDRSHERVARRDAEIAKLNAAGNGPAVIAAAVGVSLSTVERALRRLADAAERDRAAEGAEPAA